MKKVGTIFSIWVLLFAMVALARTPRSVTWVVDSTRTIHLNGRIKFLVDGETLALPSGMYLLLATDASGSYWVYDGGPFVFSSQDKSLSVGGIFISMSSGAPYGIWASRELRKKRSEVIFLGAIPAGEKVEVDEKKS